MSGDKVTTDDSQEVKSGLAGVISHRSSISSIIDATLTYRGINIDELAEKSTFEEVICLLWNGKLPNAAELEEMRGALRRNFGIPPGIVALLRTLPRNANPMLALQAAVPALGTYDPDVEDSSPEANRRKALRLTPQLTTFLCAFHRIRSGLEPVEPAGDLSFAGNFFLLLNGKRPDDVQTQAIDKALILHADHELNASTFSARVTSSTLSDMHSAITAAIGTLKGPLHGGANRAVMESLQEIGSPDRLESWLGAKLARREKIMGFGHRVYKHGDPRAKHLRKMSEKLCALTGQRHWYEISVRLEELMRERKGILPNVDFYSASTYFCLGIPPDLYTAIFACSRVAGWIAHLFEQYADNDLIRPRALYTGPRKNHWVPIDQR